MEANLWAGYVLKLAIAALLLAGIWLVTRRLGRARFAVLGERRFLRVVESALLAPHLSLHVVKAGARYFLVGGASANVAALAELAAEDVEAWLARR
jgi:flagellar biogenesis protein FliO